MTQPCISCGAEPLAAARSTRPREPTVKLTGSARVSPPTPRWIGETHITQIGGDVAAPVAGAIEKVLALLER